MKKSLLTFSVCALLCASIAGMGACAPRGGELEVYAPDGAPALALLAAIDAEEKKPEETFDFEVVDSGQIQTYVAGTNPAADFCILPVNLASKLLGTGDVYQMLGVVTNGNFFFLTSGDAEVCKTLTPQNCKEVLTGKKVGVVQLPNVPGLTLKAVLDSYGAEYTVFESVQAEADPAKVNLIAFDAANVSPAGKCDYYLCPEPAVSTKIKGTQNSPAPFRMAGNLQELYGGSEGYPQAVAVAKKSVIESRPGDVATFIGYLESAENYLKTVSTETVLRLLEDVREDGVKPSFDANNLTAQVLENCSVRYAASGVCKERVKLFLDKLFAIDPASAAKPADDFFYIA